MKPLFNKTFFLLYLSFTLIGCKQTTHQLTKIKATNIAIDSSITADESIRNFINPYQKKITQEIQHVFCYSPKDLVKSDGEMQSSLGNLMADMCYNMANPIFKERTGEDIDFAMFNHGGIRAAISTGNVTKEHAFKLMPFENQLVVVTLSGEKMQELLTYFINGKKAHPLSKQVTLTLNGDNYHLEINKVPFNKNKTYNILTSDYLQNGGDSMNFFKSPKKLTKLDYKFRSAIIDYFKKVDTLKATIDNRVILK